jgi:hypothetical protein
MKRILSAVGPLLLILNAPSLLRAETLDNQAVVMLTQAGLGPDAVIAKIRTSTSNFDLSTEQLVRLKQSRVSDSVIAAMLEASTRTSVSATAAVGASNLNDPKTTRPSGIYLRTEWEQAPIMTRLDATTSAESRSTGRLASALTYGIAKVRAKMVLPTPGARVQVGNPRPVFYFYFDQTNTSLSQGSSGNNPFASLMGQAQAPVTSPNEFALVRFAQVGNNREIETASANILGSSSGTASTQRVNFTYEDVAPGIYKVMPQSDLAVGEYGFVYANSGSNAMMQIYGVGGGGSKVFDFAIKAQ